MQFCQICSVLNYPQRRIQQSHIPQYRWAKNKLRIDKDMFILKCINISQSDTSVQIFTISVFTFFLRLICEISCIFCALLGHTLLVLWYWRDVSIWSCSKASVALWIWAGRQCHQGEPRPVRVSHGEETRHTSTLATATTGTLRPGASYFHIPTLYGLDSNENKCRGWLMKILITVVILSLWIYWQNSHNFQGPDLEEILTDSWDVEPDARLTAHCVADRLVALQSCYSIWLFSLLIIILFYFFYS